MRRTLGWLLVWLMPVSLHAETGYDTWLRYAALEDGAARQYRAIVPDVVTALRNGVVEHSAQQELIRGIRGMLHRRLRADSRVPGEAAIVLGTLADFRRTAPQFALVASLEPDGYWLTMVRVNGIRYTVVTAANDRGVLYGAFALLRKIALGESVADLNEQQTPSAPIRWVNQWDDLDGSIERGYGGPSIFWENGRARVDLTRVGDYGRMLASLGITGCSINNVNADPRLLGSDLIPQVARIAEAFRPWGVQVALAVDFGSPRSLGGLDTFDPLDPAVIAWWKSKADEIYRAVGDFGGFVLKADSEGRAGPSTYGRTHADAANVVARALKGHAGIVFYRGFVYDHHMDWENPKNDRARAAYDNFHDLDGKFDDNVIIQIKNGPIDFQVREPASPLFGALEMTREAIELQITQEYMGQARHLVFLAPMWKETLDFDMHVRDRGTPVGTPVHTETPVQTPVKMIVSGKVFGRSGGFVGVSNLGMDNTWYGNHMSQANLYAFGRLAWDPDLSARDVAEDWTRLTFGSDPAVVKTITDLQLTSWRTYENYTGPLGLQTLTDIVGNHYGVAVEASERNGWGQWHKADESGVGFDRTVATGTGFLGQYAPAVTKSYESVRDCPDDLVLFMHHVPYTHRLHSGSTVIQYLYDSHYDGAENVARYVRGWRALRGRIDEQRYSDVLAQLEYQAGQAIVWRDAVSDWFLKESGIPDAKGRVGHHPDRVEAESTTLDGYVVKAVTPWESASGGKAVECSLPRCSSRFTYDGESGSRDLIVQYFDQSDGVSRFRVWVANRLVAEWAADDRLPTRKVDSSSSSRRVIRGIPLRQGDEIRIEGAPDGRETAALDYVEIRPSED
jgi:alpha-glucuronidase